MALISLHDVTLIRGNAHLFSQASLHVEQGDRVCIMGRNGAGKSSLLALMAGLYEPDAGSVTRQVHIPFGIMAQDVPITWTGKVFDVVAEGFGELGVRLAEAYTLSLQMNDAAQNLNEGSSDAASSTVNLEPHAFGDLGNVDVWDLYNAVINVIHRLGLQADSLMETLSGGTKRRVALARALLTSDNLLLDEPTNHLDINTITWLEDFLLRRGKTLVFISHDKAFVRRLATRFIEIEAGRVHSYLGHYERYLELREARLLAEEHEQAVFDKKLAQEEVWIRQGIKARRTRNMGRVRALESLRTERKARIQREGTLHLQAHKAERSGNMVIEAHDVSFVFPDKPDAPPIIRNFSTRIMRGERIGLIGPNGMGKTTLLRLLLQAIQATSGEIIHGTRLQVAYFDQMRAQLDPTLTVMQAVADGNDTVIIDGNSRHVASYLKDFLFQADRLQTPVGLLSGGERNRLLLARLFTQPSNVLVLDEPTNDLDMPALELLEEYLAEYAGTILMVSHDRAFLDAIVTSTLVFEGDGHIQAYAGGYSDWLAQRPNTENTGNETTLTSKKTQSSSATLKGVFRFKEQRELQEIKQSLSTIEAEGQALEDALANTQAELDDPDLFAANPKEFHDATENLIRLSTEQDALLERWTELEARLEELTDMEQASFGE